MDPTDPVRLLAILKNPLVRLGLSEDDLRSRRRDLERYVLRGPRRQGWPALRARLADAGAGAKEIAGDAESGRAARLDAAAALLDRLQAGLDLATKAFEAGQASPAAAARAVVSAAEALAAGADGGLGGLWSGAAGDSAGALMAALADEGTCLPPTWAGDFAALIQSLIAGFTVRTGGNIHPRLRILGAIEARLIRADRLILAGLEEGCGRSLRRPIRSCRGRCARPSACRLPSAVSASRRTISPRPPAPRR